MQYPELHLQALKKALLELSDYSNGKALLCVENSPFTPIVIEVLSDMVRNNKVFLTLDLAKLYSADGTIRSDVEQFFFKKLR